MKKLVVIVALLLGNVVYGQRSLTSSEAKDLEITTGFRNGDEILEFTLEDGNIVKKGSEFIIGTPLNPTTFTYTRIYVGYYNLFSEILSPSITLNSSFKGTKVVVETLKVNRQKLKRKSDGINRNCCSIWCSDCCHCTSEKLQRTTLVCVGFLFSFWPQTLIV
jgi:hypothetical protein